MLWIDTYAGAGVDLDQPGELHDGAASGVEDHPFDVAPIPIDLIGLSANDGYLCCRGHVPWELGPPPTSGSVQVVAPERLWAGTPRSD